jgi:hypothetical protein
MTPNIVVDPVYHEPVILAEPSSYGEDHHYHIAEKGEVTHQIVEHNSNTHTAYEPPTIKVSNTYP